MNNGLRKSVACYCASCNNTACRFDYFISKVLHWLCESQCNGVVRRPSASRRIARFHTCFLKRREPALQSYGAENKSTRWKKFVLRRMAMSGEAYRFIAAVGAALLNSCDTIQEKIRRSRICFNGFLCVFEMDKNAWGEQMRSRAGAAMAY